MTKSERKSPGRHSGVHPVSPGMPRTGDFRSTWGLGTWMTFLGHIYPSLEAPWRDPIHWRLPTFGALVWAIERTTLLDPFWPYPGTNDLILGNRRMGSETSGFVCEIRGSGWSRIWGSQIHPQIPLLPEYRCSEAPQSPISTKGPQKGGTSLNYADEWPKRGVPECTTRISPPRLPGTQ